LEPFPTVKLRYTITKYDTRAYRAYDRSGLNCEHAANYKPKRLMIAVGVWLIGRSIGKAW